MQGLFFRATIGSMGQDERLLLGGTWHPLDLHARMHFVRVLLGPAPLEVTPHRVRRADDLRTAALARELRVVLADHPAIHHPDPMRTERRAAHGHQADDGGGIPTRDCSTQPAPLKPFRRLIPASQRRQWHEQLARTMRVRKANHGTAHCTALLPFPVNGGNLGARKGKL